MKKEMTKSEIAKASDILLEEVHQVLKKAAKHFEEVDPSLTIFFVGSYNDAEQEEGSVSIQCVGGLIGNNGKNVDAVSSASGENQVMDEILRRVFIRKMDPGMSPAIEKVIHKLKENM